MRLTHFLPAILIVIVLFACQTGPKKGVVTKIHLSNIDKFWVQNDAKPLGEALSLANQSSSIISKFKVRNFEFSARIKTTPGAEGLLVFAAPNEGDSGKGYAITINNSDWIEIVSIYSNIFTFFRNRETNISVFNMVINVGLREVHFCTTEISHRRKFIHIEL